MDCVKAMAYPVLKFREERENGTETGTERQENESRWGGLQRRA